MTAVSSTIVYGTLAFAALGLVMYAVGVFNQLVWGLIMADNCQWAVDFHLLPKGEKLLARLCSSEPTYELEGNPDYGLCDQHAEAVQQQGIAVAPRDEA